MSLLIGGCGSEGTVGTSNLSTEVDGILYDVAGTAGIGANDGDGGKALDSFLYWVCDVTVTPAGELLVMDWNNHRIRRIDTDGIIHSFVGSGYIGDGVSGSGTMIELYNPADMKVGPDGNYYVADYHNTKIKAFDGATLQCSVHAGTIKGFAGDGGIATQARMDGPGSLLFDPAGNMYILDQGNSRVRKVDPQTGIITTFVGSVRGYVDGVGEAAQFAFPIPQPTHGPRGATIDLSLNGEDIYVADTENQRIRKINIATRMVTTIAGTGGIGYAGDGGPALMAQLNYPMDVACASDGSIYIADAHNNVIRKIDAAGIITTVVGTGTGGSSPNGTRAGSAMLLLPSGVAYDNATNTLYVADTYNHQIKKVRNP
jgi:sugar lactone lactonase YvrE